LAWSLELGAWSLELGAWSNRCITCHHSELESYWENPGAGDGFWFDEYGENLILRVLFQREKQLNSNIF
jgi:hypothetical protein